MTPAAVSENGSAAVWPLYWPQSFTSCWMFGSTVAATGIPDRSAKMPRSVKSAVAELDPRVTTSGGSSRIRPGTKLSLVEVLDDRDVGVLRLEVGDHPVEVLHDLALVLHERSVVTPSLEALEQPTRDALASRPTVARAISDRRPRCGRVVCRGWLLGWLLGCICGSPGLQCLRTVGWVSPALLRWRWQESSLEWNATGIHG